MRAAGFADDENSDERLVFADGASTSGAIKWAVSPLRKSRAPAELTPKAHQVSAEFNSPAGGATDSGSDDGCSGWDIVFPVVLPGANADAKFWGLSVCWNHGDTPGEVVDRFVEENSWADTDPALRADMESKVAMWMQNIEVEEEEEEEEEEEDDDDDDDDDYQDEEEGGFESPNEQEEA